jgi:hypothetical protein
MERRALLTAGAGALAGLAGFPFGWALAADKPKRRILYFTRCVSYEHEVVERLMKLLADYVEKERSTPGAAQENEVNVDIWKH